MGKFMLCQSVRFTAMVGGNDAVSAPSMAIADAAVAEAVLVVADAAIPPDTLDRQCEALAGDGMVVQRLQVGRCRHYRELPSIAEACAAAISHWQQQAPPHLVTLLVWCPMASPLRVLPLLAATAQAIMVRAYGHCPNRRDGCLDHCVKVMRLPVNYFDGDLDNWKDGRRIFTPDNSREALTWRRLCKTIEQAVRPFAVRYEEDFDAKPLARLDLPLVNGKLLGETDDDPRNQ